jgi:3-methyladenine DNA glycosylase AlkC
MPASAPLKDSALSRERLEQIAKEVRSVYPEFAGSELVHSALSAFPQLELKGRISWVADELRRLLPADFEAAARILMGSLPLTPAGAGVDSDFGSFKYAPHSRMVALYGCTSGSLRTSLECLRRLTAYYTAEDAIRYFINSFPDETLAELGHWAGDPDHRVRRLASEGTRPKLPWSARISTPVEAALPILDRLAGDTNRFVTTSVANHVNDIAQGDPSLALDLLRKWSKTDPPPADLSYIARQGLRSLVKSGHEEALDILGYSPDLQVTVTRFSLDRDTAREGDSVELRLDLRAHSDGQLLIDYVLGYPTASATRRGSKVYRLKTLPASSGQEVSLVRRHTVKGTSGRPVRPGPHDLSIQVNGTVVAKAEFRVLAEG